jgi:spermidine/putrescine-binding protein
MKKPFAKVKNFWGWLDSILVLYTSMKTFCEFAQIAANIAGTNAGQIINQLDPMMKAQWEKIVADFPKLYAFLGELNKVSRGSWKVAPAQFTTLLNKHIVGAAGSKGSAMTAPMAPKI